MTPKQRRAEYLALIEVAAHAVAIGGVGKLPSAVNDLISRACEIVGGWSGHDPEAPPGSCRLPLVDQTIDRVIARANELRYELVGKLYGTRAEKRERDALAEEMRQTRREEDCGLIRPHRRQ